jgi:hypothetical protein
MRLQITKPDGTSRSWVAKTSRGFNRKQRKEIATFRDNREAIYNDGNHPYYVNADGSTDYRRAPERNSYEPVGKEQLEAMRFVRSIRKGFEEQREQDANKNATYVPDNVGDVERTR